MRFSFAKFLHCLSFKLMFTSFFDSSPYSLNNSLEKPVAMNFAVVVG